MNVLRAFPIAPTVIPEISQPPRIVRATRFELFCEKREVVDVVHVEVVTPVETSRPTVIRRVKRIGQRR